MKRILPWVMSVLLAFTCLNISPSSAAAENLVLNGSFEDPAIDTVLTYETSFNGWKLSKGFLMEIDRDIFYGASNAKDGKQYVELDSFNQVTQIYQDVPTEAGKTYKLTFGFSPRPENPENKLNVHWGNTTIAKLEANGEGLSKSDWQDYSYGVKATGTETRISFDNLNETPDGLGSLIDAIGLEILNCDLGDDDCTIIIPPDGTFVMPVTIPIPEDAGVLPVDLILTQDLTSSFSDDLPTLKTVIPDLVTELKAVQPDTNFGLASFADKKIYGTPDYYVYKTELPLTSDSSVFEDAVAGLATLGGGKDFPESSLSALMQVALRTDGELEFRDETRRIAIISTDDAYKKAGDYPQGTPNNGDTVLDEAEDYPSVAQTKDAINNANILPIFLVTRPFISTYNNLVSQLGVGAVVELQPDSSNLVEAVLEAIEILNQTVTVVAVDDDYGYVQSIDPDYFENVVPGSELITYVTFKDTGLGSGDDVTIRALGIGDLVVDVKVPL
ncbi:DUF642 domain-containing protein [Okeania sp. KiyG1]|uniref:DUF642 domain-containing protein n=1 Tax=Okeania sp. KiyG1 TaxID=2720165 RepID=UPI001924C9FB|nr:DUF642 domain-containing protein [Okeania sp. KiyG1]GGA34698.1 hypothetical protein CYANOKiyG1_52110 [Okeania sp. KiyG1]